MLDADSDRRVKHTDKNSNFVDGLFLPNRVDPTGPKTDGGPDHWTRLRSTPNLRSLSGHFSRLKSRTARQLAL